MFWNVGNIQIQIIMKFKLSYTFKTNIYKTKNVSLSLKQDFVSFWYRKLFHLQHHESYVGIIKQKIVAMFTNYLFTLVHQNLSSRYDISAIPKSLSNKFNCNQKMKKFEMYTRSEAAGYDTSHLIGFNNQSIIRICNYQLIVYKRYISFYHCTKNLS